MGGRGGEEPKNRGSGNMPREPFFKILNEINEADSCWDVLPHQVPIILLSNCNFTVVIYSEEIQYISSTTQCVEPWN